MASGVCPAEVVGSSTEFGTVQPDDIIGIPGPIIVCPGPGREHRRRLIAGIASRQRS